MGPHPAPCLINTGGSSPGVRRPLLEAHLKPHVVPGLRTSGVIPSFYHYALMQCTCTTVCVRDSFNPLALLLDIYSLAHRLCKMGIFYEPRRVTLGNTRHFVEK